MNLYEKIKALNIQEKQQLRRFQQKVLNRIKPKRKEQR